MFCIKNAKERVEEIAKQLRAPTALPEDSGTVLSSDMAADNGLNSNSRRSTTPHRCTYRLNTKAHKNNFKRKRKV